MMDTFGVILEGEAMQRAHTDGEGSHHSGVGEAEGEERREAAAATAELEDELGPMTCCLHVGT